MRSAASVLTSIAMSSAYVVVNWYTVPPAATTSGAAYDVIVGPAVSTVTFRAALGADSFPAASTAVTVNGSDPSASAAG